MKIKKHTIFFSVIFILLLQVYPGAQNVNDMDKKASELFDRREYNRAVTLWLDILAIDPENEKVQQKVEMVYELKMRKDLAFQRSRMNYRIARNKLKKEEDKELEFGIKTGKNAIKGFVYAYKIDPNDSDMRQVLDDMKRLEAEIKAAEEKLRISRAIREKVRMLKEQARIEMASKKPDYEKALKMWNKVLSYMAKDSDALEGKRECELAIENRLKYERIRNFLVRGKDLFQTRKYKLARIEFKQVLSIDPRNREAKDYLEKIVEIVEENVMKEQRLKQAEDFYISGTNNLRYNNFDQAEEDFESALSLVKNYRDSKQKLDRIPELRKAYDRQKQAEKLLRINQNFQDGIIAFSTGKYRRAIAAFVATLALDKKNSQAREYLKRARDAQSQIEEERVDENSPYFDIVQSLITAGRSLYNKGKYRESRQKWDNILKLFPKNRVATEFLIKCDLRLNPGARDVMVGRQVRQAKEYLKSKDYKSAERILKIIQSIDRRYPGLNALLAQARAGIKGADEVKLEPADRAEINRRYRAGMALYQQGGKENITRALGLFRWVVRKDPKNIKAVIVVNKIESQLRLNQPVAARKKKLNPRQQQLANKFYYQGINYYSNNKFREAIQAWRKVLAIDPGNIKARNNIRKVLVFLGR